MSEEQEKRGIRESSPEAVKQAYAQAEVELAKKTFAGEIVLRAKQELDGMVERVKQYGLAAETHLKQRIGGMAKKAEGELLNKPRLVEEGEESIRRADANMRRLEEIMSRNSNGGERSR
jgi:hypothetical protein